MKKILLILLCMCCLLGFAGCSKSIAGDYYLSSYTDSEDPTVEKNYNSMMEYGLYIKIHFEEDGTGYLDMLGEKDIFTYDSKEKTLRFEGSSSSEKYEVKGDTIVLSPGTTTMTFTKGSPEDE